MRFELATFRPVGRLSQYFFLDDVLVRIDSLAVKYRKQHSSALKMWFAIEEECRAGAEYLAQVGRAVEQFAAGREDIFGHGRLANHHRFAENRQIDRERAAITSAQHGK